MEQHAIIYMRPILLPNTVPDLVKMMEPGCPQAEGLERGCAVTGYRAKAQKGRWCLLPPSRWIWNTKVEGDEAKLIREIQKVDARRAAHSEISWMKFSSIGEPLNQGLRFGHPIWGEVLDRHMLS